MIDFKEVVRIAKQAGDAIMEVYHSTDLGTEYKDDKSPLTKADKASHEVIFKLLSEKYNDIPILSEEGNQPDYQTRKTWSKYWIIDPLDGTKEFIKRNGEFTVNIALIENKRPVLGVIYVPVQEITYVGSPEGAFKQEKNGEFQPISVVKAKRNSAVAVRSKSHPSPEEEVVLNQYSIQEFMAVGSSLKFCMVAEGKADIYYRHGPTMEWDTAAGQAIATSAGAKVFQGQTTENEFVYNKENLLNGSFLCIPECYLS